MLILIATTQIHDDQVQDLIYRLNLQRRGNQRGILGGGKAEMGFDTNWIAIFSRMYLPKDKQMTEVQQVGSQLCKIHPKSMVLLDNGDLIVSSYSSQGVKIRAFTTSPFCKISKGAGTKRINSLSQSTLATVSGWTKDAGIKEFVDLRYKWPLFKLYTESPSQDFC